MNEPNQLLAIVIVAGGLGYMFATIMGLSDRASKMVAFFAMACTFFYFGGGPTVTNTGLYLT